jgi:hypothetical protein
MCVVKRFRSYGALAIFDFFCYKDASPNGLWDLANVIFETHGSTSFHAAFA